MNKISLDEWNVLLWEWMLMCILSGKKQCSMSEILLFLISKYFELIGKFFVLLSQIFRAAPRSLKEYEKMWFYVESCENLKKKE